MFRLITAALIFAAPLAQAQDKPELLGEFKAWSVYSTTDGAGRLCYAMSQAEEVSPKSTGTSESYAFLSHWTDEGVKNELNVVTGFDFEEDGSGTISVDGNDFTIFTRGNEAWLKDPTRNDAFAEAMSHGSNLVLVSKMANGDKVTLKFSLSGSSKATQTVNECE